MTRLSRSTFFALAPMLALSVVVALPLSALAQSAGSGGLVPKHDQPKQKSDRPEPGITEEIGAQIPLDLNLRDENDQPITFGDAMAGKPTILVPVYYRCPMLCSEILNELLQALREMPPKFTAGEQFTVITVSMDPKEHGDLARSKKKAYLAEYGRPGAENGWRFLTGDINEKVATQRIATLLDTVGYRFEFDKMLKEYNHPSGIIILSPQGKVTRYFHGLTYRGEKFRVNGPDVQGPDGKYTKPTTSLRLSLVEAAEGKGGSLLDQITLLCYRYDRLHQGYSLNVLRAVQIAGIITLLLVGGAALFFVRREGLLRVALVRIGTFVLICIAISSLGLGSSLMRGRDATGATILFSISFLSVLGLSVIAFCRYRANRAAELAATVATGPNDTQPAGGTV